MPLGQTKPQAINLAWWYISFHNLPMWHLFNFVHSLLNARSHLEHERIYKDVYFCHQRINFQLKSAVNLPLSTPHQGPHPPPQRVKTALLANWPPNWCAFYCSSSALSTGTYSKPPCMETVDSTQPYIHYIFSYTYISIYKSATVKYNNTNKIGQV